MKKLLILLAGAALLLPAAAAAGGGLTFPDRHAVPEGAAYVGSEVCAECHEDIAGFYAGMAHDPAAELTVPGTEVSTCEACHGPGGLHVDEGGERPIWGADFMAGLSADDRDAMCLQCHSGQKRAWLDSPHAGDEAGCVSCHVDQVHAGGAVRPFADFRIEGEFCLQCHAEQAGDFRLPYRHRVLEGEMGCTACHDPHGDESGAIIDDNAVCLTCHSQMAGPFVFEHEGVAGEECAACHRPHGAINDKLLAQDNNALCLQCHYQPDFPVVGSVNHGGFLNSASRCYDCHVQVHGSNINPAFTE